mmetsp:Transcript_18588/g.28933  ORF Transcript_18588/g.28933 Transcript_18588/m.28933 type:complete len:183 (+) Transcript_18588:4426-4974(+)
MANTNTCCQEINEMLMSKLTILTFFLNFFIKTKTNNSHLVYSITKYVRFFDFFSIVSKIKKKKNFLREIYRKHTNNFIPTEEKMKKFKLIWFFNCFRTKIFKAKHNNIFMDPIDINSNWTNRNIYQFIKKQRLHRNFYKNKNLKIKLLEFNLKFLLNILTDKEINFFFYYPTLVPFGFAPIL